MQNLTATQMTDRAQPMGHTQLKAVSNLREIDSERIRLEQEISQATNLMAQLSRQLQIVRADEPPVPASAGVAESQPSTALGATLRGMSDQVRALCASIEYQMRTVQLSD